MLKILETDEGIIFNVLIAPKSSKNKIEGVFNNAIKIKVTAPPIDGKANEVFIKLLSKKLNIPRSSFKIISGEKSKAKKILIKGYFEDKSQLIARIKSLVL